MPDAAPAPLTPPPADQTRPIFGIAARGQSEPDDYFLVDGGFDDEAEAREQVGDGEQLYVMWRTDWIAAD